MLVRCKNQRVASVSNVDESMLRFELEDSESAKETEQKARDLVSLMKKKLNVWTRRQKIKILTLTPKSWNSERQHETSKFQKVLSKKLSALEMKRGLQNFLQLVKRRG